MVTVSSPTGTLTFSAGESSKTIAVLDHAHDEGEEETFTLALSNALGGRGWRTPKRPGRFYLPVPRSAPTDRRPTALGTERPPFGTPHGTEQPPPGGRYPARHRLAFTSRLFHLFESTKTRLLWDEQVSAATVRPRCCGPSSPSAPPGDHPRHPPAARRQHVALTRELDDIREDLPAGMELVGDRHHRDRSLLDDEPYTPVGVLAPSCEFHLDGGRRRRARHPLAGASGRVVASGAAAMGRRRLRAPDRLRQRRESDAGPATSGPAGVRGPGRGGGRPRAPAAATAGRERGHRGPQRIGDSWRPPTPSICWSPHARRRAPPRPGRRETNWSSSSSPASSS